VLAFVVRALKKQESSIKFKYNFYYMEAIDNKILEKINYN